MYRLEDLTKCRRGNEISRSESALESHLLSIDEEVKDESLPDGQGQQQALKDFLEYNIPRSSYFPIDLSSNLPSNNRNLEAFERTFG